MVKKENENLKISVLMPVYNAANFLNECIESIIFQTENNWELICVDDFSTDSSLSILKEYQKIDSRIKPYSNSQKGIIPSLRKAYENSSGNMVTRMDADDKMHPNKLKELSKLLKKYGPDYCATGWVEYFPESDIKDGYTKYADWLNQLTKNNNHYSEIYKECVVASPCWMVYKSDLEKCGAFSSSHYPEDYDLVFRFYKSGIKIIGAPTVLHYWRDHPARASRNDENYSDQSFIHLKLPYFLDLDRQKSKPLFIWGAGNKGKSLAKILKLRSEFFRWLSNNPKKIGHKIYDVEIESFETLRNLPDFQIIISISNENDKKEVTRFLEDIGKVKNKDYFLFY